MILQGQILEALLHLCNEIVIVFAFIINITKL